MGWIRFDAGDGSIPNLARNRTIITALLTHSAHTKHPYHQPGAFPGVISVGLDGTVQVALMYVIFFPAETQTLS
jgi:hypothetical protein